MSLDELNAVLEDPLTELQFEFCKSYLETNNGMKAIRDAGYNHSTPGSQGSASYRLLRNKKIQLALGVLKNHG